MDKTIFGIENFDTYMVIGIIVFFGLAEVISGALKASRRNSSDWIQEVGGFFALSLLIKPGIVLGTLALGNLIFPESLYALGNWSLWIMLPFYMLIDDVLQYWYHRSAHEYEWLWKLHRPHHQAEEMGFFVSYRNAALYYFIMPNLWWVGTVVFLGGAKAVAIGLILKQLVIIASHSTTKWDQYFYNNKFLFPIIAVLERIIITPAFHFAHHGKSMLDGVSDPNGNYGNMFSFWDQLFGTAKFSHDFPTEFGLMNNPNEKWTASYFYPVVTSEQTESEISRGYVKEKTATPEPLSVPLEKGKKYLWCACGKSKNQPFCDGTHHGSKHKPILFEVKRSGDFRICNCKISKTSPFCDDSHLDLK